MQRKDQNHRVYKGSFHPPGYIKALSPAGKETVELGSVSPFDGKDQGEELRTYLPKPILGYWLSRQDIGGNLKLIKHLGVFFSKIRDKLNKLKGIII